MAKVQLTAEDEGSGSRFLDHRLRSRLTAKGWWLSQAGCYAGSARSVISRVGLGEHEGKHHAKGYSLSGLPNAPHLRLKVNRRILRERSTEQVLLKVISYRCGGTDVNREDRCYRHAIADGWTN